MYTRSTEIRHLAATDIYQLSQILEHVNSWKKLMANIPKIITSPLTPNAPRKYTSEHIRLIENASMKQNRTGAEILFDEWGTSGRKRPTVGNLLDLLIEAELFRAADFVAGNLLNEPAPERPAKGPAAKVDISLPFHTEEIKAVDAIMDAVSYPGSSVLIRNAKEPSDVNNHDYYTKLGHDRQKVDISVSDLIKFSTTSMFQGELPNLSAFGERSNEDNLTPLQITSQSSNTQNTLPVLSSQNRDFESKASDDDEVMDNRNIPAISALQMYSSNTIERGLETSSELPNLSALNLNVGNHSLTISTNTLTSISDPTSNLDRQDFHLEANNMCDNDNNITPDLSILGQDSLDDSSLTNITETSEDLSFDAGTRLNLSENNIPMLSILQK